MFHCARYIHAHFIMGLTSLIFTKTSWRQHSCQLQLQLKQEGRTSPGVRAQTTKMAAHSPQSGPPRHTTSHSQHGVCPHTRSGSVLLPRLGVLPASPSLTTASDAFLNTWPNLSSSLVQWFQLLPVFFRQRLSMRGLKIGSMSITWALV